MDEGERRDILADWSRGAVHVATFGTDRLGRLAADLAVRALEAWTHGADATVASLISCRTPSRRAARRHLLRHDPEAARGRTPRERREALDAEIDRKGLCEDMKPLAARRYLANVLGIAVDTADDPAAMVLALLALASIARLEDRTDPDERPPTPKDVEFFGGFAFLGAYRLQGAMAELDRRVERVDDPAPAAAVARAVLDGDADEDDATFVRRVRALVTPTALAALRPTGKRRGRPLKDDSQVERVTRFVEKSGRSWSAKQLAAVPDLKGIKALRAVLSTAARKHPTRIKRHRDSEGDVMYGPSRLPPEPPGRRAR